METISKLEEFKNDLYFLVEKARKPLIWLESFDFNYIIELLRGFLGEKANTISLWERATGNLINIRGDVVVNKQCPLTEYILHPEIFNRLLIAKVSEMIFEADKNDRLSASLQNFVDENNKKNYDEKKTILIITPYHFEVKGLEHMCERLEMPRPDKQDILRELFERMDIDGHREIEFCESFKLNGETNQEKLVDALRGMYLYDIKNLLKTIQFESYFGKIAPFDFNYGKLDERVKRGKKQIVKNSGLLEVIEVEKEYYENIADIDNLIEHLNTEKKLIQNQRFLSSKLPKPKGILLVGAPGCGKSESAKAAASILELPLYRLNIGDLMGHKYGQSENRFNEALRTADGSAPCVLWIDEIEKAFAGAGSGDENNDVLIHILGRFLTWMQEHETLVYLVATANDLSKMRPELLRKGRWDEIFYISYPSEEGRENILRKCLQRYNLKIVDDGKNINAEQIKKIILSFDGMSGAEISSKLIEAAKESFKSDGESSTMQGYSNNEVSIEYRSLIGDDSKEALSSKEATSPSKEEIKQLVDKEIRELEIKKGGRLENSDYVRGLLLQKYSDEGNDAKLQFSTARYRRDGYKSASNKPE